MERSLEIEALNKLLVPGYGYGVRIGDHIKAPAGPPVSKSGGGGGAALDRAINAMIKKARLRGNASSSTLQERQSR